MKAYFFGVEGARSNGHFLYQCFPDGRIEHVRTQHSILDPALLDGRLTPPDNNEQGNARMHWLGGYTLLAWHDYTGDNRPGSNSVFIVEGEHAFLQMVAFFRIGCPAIFTRQPQITLIGKNDRP